VLASYRQVGHKNKRRGEKESGDSRPPPSKERGSHSPAPQPPETSRVEDRPPLPALPAFLVLEAPTPGSQYRRPSCTRTYTPRIPFQVRPCSPHGAQWTESVSICAHGWNAAQGTQASFPQLAPSRCGARNSRIHQGRASRASRRASAPPPTPYTRPSHHGYIAAHPRVSLPSPKNRLKKKREGED
jgi:hypothetical protein